MTKVVVKRIPFELLEGLPFEDQVAIKKARGKEAVLISNVDNKSEVEFRDEFGNLHTIWIDPSCLEIKGP